MRVIVVGTAGAGGAIASTIAEEERDVRCE